MSSPTVLLINPNNEKAPYPVPPLGLCLVAAALERTGNYRVRLYDGTFDEGRSLGALLAECRPDYIGISIRNVDDMNYHGTVLYSPFIEERYLRQLRDACDAPVILGGSGFNIFPLELMAYYHADYGVIGEGEVAFPRLLETLELKGDPASVPGVLTAADRVLPRAYPPVDFSGTPASDIDLRLDFAPYRSRGSYPVQTKRGCAHRCVYCTYPCIEGSAYRVRSPRDIADEIENAAGRLGDVSFEFVDSIFNDPPGHAEAICAEIARRKLGVRLRTMGINPAHASGTLFELMLEAGFTQIDCTPDTASPALLASYRKNFTLADLERTALLIREFDIPTMWFFIFGGPGETRDTVAETFSFIDALVGRLDMVHMAEGMRIYPGTGLHETAVLEGLLDAGASLLEPRFYLSKGFAGGELTALLKQASLERPNCIPSHESRPPAELLAQAMALRARERLTEPVFRTLLRLRAEFLSK